MIRHTIAMTLLAALSVSAQEPSAQVQVRLADGSQLTLTMLDDSIPLQTPHGRLVIPLREIRQIDVGPRLPEAIRQLIDAGLAELRHTEVARRDAAGEKLLKIGRRAYPAVVRASKSEDRDLAITARQLLAKFQETFAEEKLPAHDLDVIQTDEWRIAGRIELPMFNVTDPKFGDKTLRLADLVSVRFDGKIEPEEKLTVLPDPGSLSNLANQTGKSFLFRVTGSRDGTIYGTDVYTTDSSLATACVHSGKVPLGQTRTVRVTILPGQPQYIGSSRNGVASNGWGQYSASYRITSVFETPK